LKSDSLLYILSKCLVLLLQIQQKASNKTNKFYKTRVRIEEYEGYILYI
jgi:hypothetical protein